MKNLVMSLVILAFATAPVAANMVVDGGFELGLVGEDWLWLYDGDFFLQNEGFADLAFIGKWGPVVGRSAFNYVGNINFFAREAHSFYDFC